MGVMCDCVFKTSAEVPAVWRRQFKILPSWGVDDESESVSGVL